VLVSLILTVTTSSVVSEIGSLAGENYLRCRHGIINRLIALIDKVEFIILLALSALNMFFKDLQSTKIEIVKLLIVSTTGLILLIQRVCPVLQVGHD